MHSLGWALQHQSILTVEVFLGRQRLKAGSQLGRVTPPFAVQLAGCAAAGSLCALTAVVMQLARASARGLGGGGHSRGGRQETRYWANGIGHGIDGYHLQPLVRGLGVLL